MYAKVKNVKWFHHIIRYHRALTYDLLLIHVYMYLSHIIHIENMPLLGWLVELFVAVGVLDQMIFYMNCHIACLLFCR